MTQTKLRRLPMPMKDLELKAGPHGPDSTFCIMEAVAYVAREPWSDSPECVSPVIGAFLRSWNDTMTDTDRQKLKPYIRKVIGTNTGQADDEERAWLATDWLVRTFAPEWLDLAGLTEHAAKLRDLPKLETSDLAKQAHGTIAAARNAARDAAWDAARDAAWAAARDAAWDAAGNAAWGAAWGAARDAAWDAAWDAAGNAAWGAAWDAAGDAAWGAAWDAAWGAARDALAPTVKKLQRSAFTLLDDMIAVGQ